MKIPKIGKKTTDKQRPDLGIILEGGCMNAMTLTEKLIKEFEELPESKKVEVIDYIEFLLRKEKAEMEKLMDDVISENLSALRKLAK